jgi:hypothetical protein
MITIRTIIASFLLVLVACKGKEASIQPSDLQGNWQCLKGEYEFLEFSAENDEYIIYGSFGQRLSLLGNWEISNNTLVIVNTNNEIEQYALSYSGDTLLFNGGKQKFIRVSSSQNMSNSSIVYIEPTDLLTTIANNAGYNFSAASSINEQWLPSASEWLMISVDIIFNEDFSELSSAQNTVLGILNAQGFVVANDYVTEIMNGYTLGNTLVILRTNVLDAPPVKGDTITLDVICGKIN